MKIILQLGDADVDMLMRLAAAAQNAIEYEKKAGRPSGNLMGLRVNGLYYSVKWGKDSVTVWPNG